MSKHVLQTPEGKRVVIDPVLDPCLYSAPVNPPNTGTTYTSGTDLYAHKARSGQWYYYHKHWSMWQGTETHWELVDKQEAEQFLLCLAGLDWPAGIDEADLKELAEYGFNLLTETA